MRTSFAHLARRRAGAFLALGAVLAIAEGCALVLGFDETSLLADEAGPPDAPDGTTPGDDDASGGEVDGADDGSTDKDSSSPLRDADASADASDGATVDAASLPHADCLAAYPAKTRATATLTPISVAGQGSYVVRASESTTNLAPVQLVLCEPGQAKPVELSTLSVDIVAPYVWDFGPIVLQPGTTQLALVYGAPASQVWITTSFTR